MSQIPKLFKFFWISLAIRVSLENPVCAILERVIVSVNESGAVATVGLCQRLQERTGLGKFLKDFVGVVFASIIDDNQPGIWVSCRLYYRIPVINELSDIVFFVIGGDYYI